jgi:hypothetical protein
MSVAIQFIELEVNILNILKLFSAHDKWSKWLKIMKMKFLFLHFDLQER